MKSVSTIFAEFILSSRFEDLGTDVVQQTKKVILDLIGVLLAGYQATASAKVFVVLLVRPMSHYFRIAPAS